MHIEPREQHADLTLLSDQAFEELEKGCWPFNTAMYALSMLRDKRTAEPVGQRPLVKLEPTDIGTLCDFFVDLGDIQHTAALYRLRPALAPIKKQVLALAKQELVRCQPLVRAELRRHEATGI